MRCPPRLRLDRRGDLRRRRLPGARRRTPAPRLRLRACQARGGGLRRRLEPDPRVGPRRPAPRERLRPATVGRARGRRRRDLPRAARRRAADRDLRRRHDHPRLRPRRRCGRSAPPRRRTPGWDVQRGHGARDVDRRPPCHLRGRGRSDSAAGTRVTARRRREAQRARHEPDHGRTRVHGVGAASRRCRLDACGREGLGVQRANPSASWIILFASGRSSRRCVPGARRRS